MNRPAKLLIAVVALALASTVAAQTPPPAAPAAPAAPGASPVNTNITSIESMAWLDGCWAGNVNQRNFREQWMPLRGNTMLGLGSTVFQGKLQSHEYLRIEPRADGVYYVALPSGQTEAAFRLVAIDAVEDGATLYRFANPAHDFPQEIIYRRASDGWLYATIQGKLKGEDRKVLFPMRRIDCESGEFIRQ